MSYTGDPVNRVTDRLRLITGDTDRDEEGLTDEVYQYVYDKHNGDEVLSAIECIRYLISQYANCVTEKAGGYFVKESERYEQYKTLLVTLVSDPRTALIQAGLPYAGGIKWDDYEANKADSNNRVPESFDDFKSPSGYSPYSFSRVD